MRCSLRSIIIKNYGTLLCILCLGLISLALLPSRRVADLVSPSVAFAQERSNTYYVAQFPGPDVTTKTVNAQAQCSPNTSLICVIVLDSILAGWPQGVGAVPCANCIWVDYTAVTGSAIAFVGPNISAGTVRIGGGNIFASAAFLPTTTGLANLGTISARFAQLNIGDGSGGVRWIGTGVYTGNRSLFVPDGNSGTVLASSLTTTAATTDNVTIQGMTASGHCQLEPTNSGAAGGLASVFVSNKTTNQITVTHTATAGWTFDITCTSF